MEEIHLVNGRGVAVISEEDAELVVSAGPWYLLPGKISYATAVVECVNRRNSFVLMHRLILAAKRGQRIDHRDRNGLNNQRMNLRFCTQSQNMANREMPPRLDHLGNHLPKGVSFDRSRRKYRADIELKGRHYFSPRFCTIEESHAWYRAKAAELFGEFAR